MTATKTALVTGGAKRVGRAVVERLAEAGYEVAFTYRHGRREADELRNELASRQLRTVLLHLDFSEPDAAEQLAGWARSHFGRLDLLVNCASMYVPDDNAVGGSPALLRTLMDVNAVTPSWLIASLTPELTNAGGSVVNFLDIMVDRPWPKYSAYCASKAALHNLTLSYARKLAPHVRVNGIAPGVIDWPDDMPEADRAAYLQNVPLGRAGTPREAADVVWQLAETMPYVTGQIIRLDGGRSLR